jgi:uncharacterized membrane protein
VIPGREGLAMPSSPGLFEMRRMEALSNTIFGVAMTLLAYQVPKDRFLAADPTWGDIWQGYGSHLFALLLSFIVAGMFWYSHLRRLAYSPEGNRVEMILNLLFLFSIILLPVTTGLFGSYMNSPNVSALYGLNLTLISMLNTGLWLMAAVPRRDWTAIAAPVFATAIFVAASIIGTFAPYHARYIWPLAFVSPVLAAWAERWQKRQSAD